MSSVPIIPCLNFVVILMGPYQVWTNLPKVQVCYHSFFPWRNQLFVYSQEAKETVQICNFSWNFHFVYYSIFFQKFFQEINLFDFTSFLVCTFLIFWPTLLLHLWQVTVFLYGWVIIHLFSLRYIWNLWNNYLEQLFFFKKSSYITVSWNSLR